MRKSKDCAGIGLDFDGHQAPRRWHDVLGHSYLDVLGHSYLDGEFPLCANF